MTPYAGLLERLLVQRHVRELWFEPHGTVDVPCDEDDECSVGILRNPDGPEAAEAISSLLKRVDDLELLLEPLANLADANMNDPLRKWLTVAHIQEAAAALNSDASTQITGEKA